MKYVNKEDFTAFNNLEHNYPVDTEHPTKLNENLIFYLAYQI